MRLSQTLTQLIVEQTRFNILLDKYTKKNKDSRRGKELKPIMNLDIFYEIIKSDPTTKYPSDFDFEDKSVENYSKIKPGAYTNWLLRNYANPQLDQETSLTEYRRLFIEDLFKVNDDLKKFTKYKQYFPVDKRNIDAYTPETLFKFLQSFKLPEKKQKDIEKKELKKEVRKTREGFVHPGSDLDFVGNKWVVIKISRKDKVGAEAASWFGGYYDYEKGESRWCTSPPDSNYFNTYINQGPLYVIFPNKENVHVGKRTGLPVERYQFHFPSNQFMDRLDQRVDLMTFLNGEASELKEYFKPEFMLGISTGGGTKVEVEYPNSSSAKFIALYGFEEFFESLPKDITNLLFHNKSNEDIALDIPPSIGRFKNLTGIMLTKCVKSIPKEIENLKNLVFLCLPENPKLKEIPESVVRMTWVKFISLKGSGVTKYPKGFTDVFKVEGSLGSGFFTRQN